MTVRLSLMQLAARGSERADFLTCPRCGTRMVEVMAIAPMGCQPGQHSGPFGGRAPEGSRLGCPLTHCPHFRPRIGSPASPSRRPSLPVIDANACASFAAVHMSAPDAVDGSSTGTEVPSMWALLMLPRFGGANHADGHDNWPRHRKVGFSFMMRPTILSPHSTS
jgi:hypothetical protein